MQLNSLVLDFLYRRKITQEVIEKFDISQNINNNIIIPVRDANGAFLFSKYRRSPVVENGIKYFYDKGSSVALFAINEAKKHDTILITEGEMDCLVAWSHNIPAVSSTGGALSFQKEWKEYFENKKVIICFDNDSAGAEGIVRVLGILPEAQILLLPDRIGVKDISDYVSNGGDLHELLNTARQYLTIEEVKQDRGERIALWKNTFFHDAYIKEWERRNKPPMAKNLKYEPKTKADIIKAKAFPIDNILEFENNKTKCLWHAEKTPSLTYYPESNTCWCFGCGKYADSIEVAKKHYKLNFIEAVKLLSK
jgi:hypothetical protein